MSTKKPFHKSLSHAFDGIKELLKEERNFQIHILFAAVVIILSAFLGLNVTEWAIIILLIILVLVTEIANTSFELLFDIMHPRENRTPEQDLSVKIIKDMFAGAVLITAFGAIVIGVLIFYPHVLKLIIGQ